MNLRNKTDWKDKLFAALVYSFPLYTALEFGVFLFQQFPVLTIIQIPLIPLAIINQIPFGGLILFFVLFSAVVRNQNISHFIRFNTMQAILMEILLILISLIFNILLGALSGSLITETIFNTIFIGTLAGCAYAMIQCASGKYPDLPLISEAASGQVPY